MDYPKDFPEHLKDCVESAIAEADIQFYKALSSVEAVPKGGFEELVFRVVEKVFFAFTDQAREAVKEGAWTLERCRQGVEKYLQNLIVDAYRERNPSRNDDWLWLFEEKATAAIYASKEWRKHQREIVALAKAISGKQQPPDYRAPHSHTEAAKGDTVAEDRKSLLVAYKVKGREKGIRITDEMIAKAANPGKWNDRTMVAWWKRNYSKCKGPHDRKIRAVLVRDPASIWPSK